MIDPENFIVKLKKRLGGGLESIGCERGYLIADRIFGIDIVNMGGSHIDLVLTDDCNAELDLAKIYYIDDDTSLDYPVSLLCSLLKEIDSNKETREIIERQNKRTRNKIKEYEIKNDR